MISMNIPDIKHFTSQLFLGEAFDDFLLSEAAFVTRASFRIDGRYQSAYFENDKDEGSAETRPEFNSWKDLKEECRHLIRGKRLPVSFRIVLCCSPLSPVISGFSLALPEDTRLYLNISYQNKQLTCTTGVLTQRFIPGVHPDHEWDDAVIRFFRQKAILAELL